jgi:hypothetical protein
MTNDNVYWTQETEDAIIWYNKETDLNIKNQIFEAYLYKPFYRMCEGKLNDGEIGYREFVDYENCIKDGVDHLTSIIHKYNPEKYSIKKPNEKTTSFGYFCVCIRYYYIEKSRKALKQRQTELPLVVSDSDNDNEDIPHNVDYSTVGVLCDSNGEENDILTLKQSTLLNGMYEHFTNRPFDRMYKKNDLRMLKLINDVIIDKTIKIDWGSQSNTSKLAKVGNININTLYKRFSLLLRIYKQEKKVCVLE